MCSARKPTQSFVIFAYSLLQNIKQPLKLNKTYFSLRLNTSREFPDPVGSIESQLFIQTPEKRCLRGYWATVKNQFNAQGAHKLELHDNFFFRSHDIFFSSRVKNRSASKSNFKRYFYHSNDFDSILFDNNFICVLSHVSTLNTSLSSSVFRQKLTLW